ncbi:MAG TPA: ClpXP protease specificity-enhancing factor SspB [Polyangiaceae bacterium]|nr:ClpXP protease specificity-enhancing factor SspB [Polyangiaceae bacterium]
MQPTRLPKKKDVALALLEQASVFVHLDPRTDKVFVPPWLKRQPQLVLQVGLNMAIPIPDLEVDEAGLSCTLSFNRSPHHCQIPWNAVFALVGDNGRGMVWPDDVPPEVAAEAEKQAKAAQTKAKLAPVPAAAAEAPVAARVQAQAETAVAKPARRKKAATAGGEKKVAAAGGEKTATSAPKREAKETKKPRAPRKRKAEPAATRAPTPAAAPAPEPARTATAGAASAPPKRKRELPPYLRVVK